MTTVTITIGMNSNQTLQPLSDHRQHDFRLAVDRLLATLDATSYVRDALATSEWQDEKTGIWVQEESRTWVAGIDDCCGQLRIALALLAERFEQDAIALTAGQTALVGPTSN